jgi:hypothetical protein
MFRPAHVCLPLLLPPVLCSAPALSAAAAAQPTTYAAIEEVDFRNFTYPLSMCVATPQNRNATAKVSVTDGSFVNEALRVSIDQQMILYTDVTDDEKNEAIVPVFCGPHTANFTNVEIHIYTLRNGKPELLAKLHDDLFASDYSHYYPDPKSWLYPSIARIDASGKRLTVVKLSEGVELKARQFRLQFEPMLRIAW